MKDKLNKRVKHRQAFRPFAPVVLAERANEIFEGDEESPFMLLVKRVRPQWKDKIPAIVHVDGTARVQTIRQDQNERLYKLLQEFDAITGVPVLLNTSLNVKGEPIVETPADAVACFLNTGIDYLALHEHVDRQERASQDFRTVEEGVFRNVFGCPKRLGGRDTRLTAGNPTTTMAKRIVADQCWGLIIDVQEFFLSQADELLRSKIKTNTKNFARLLGYFRVPILITLERPIAEKGSLPEEIEHASGAAKIFEKDFFDLTKEKDIANYIARLNRKQVIVAGCETDVCVLQSCLGLLGLGYEVYAVEDLLFSSSRTVDAAIARMKAEGVVFLSYKSLYYELVEAVEGARSRDQALAQFGPFPDDLPDVAV